MANCIERRCQVDCDADCSIRWVKLCRCSSCQRTISSEEIYRYEYKTTLNHCIKLWLVSLASHNIALGGLGQLGSLTPAYGITCSYRDLQLARVSNTPYQIGLIFSVLKTYTVSFNQLY